MPQIAQGFDLMLFSIFPRKICILISLFFIIPLIYAVGPHKDSHYILSVPCSPYITSSPIVMSDKWAAMDEGAGKELSPLLSRPWPLDYDGYYTRDGYLIIKYGKYYHQTQQLTQCHCLLRSPIGH